MNKKIEIRLFATLREGRSRRSYIDANDIREILDILNIKEEEIAMLLLNGRDATLDTQINNGDILSIFPPVGGG
ncbi:MAG TPA: MoaD/ThiS family protein [Peptostreptococcaceae bacterium]|nr:MoaD/ThiS family protein [Peptostreptococcaceae bacterium]